MRQILAPPGSTFNIGVGKLFFGLIMLAIFGLFTGLTVNTVTDDGAPVMKQAMKYYGGAQAINIFGHFNFGVILDEPAETPFIMRGKEVALTLWNLPGMDEKLYGVVNSVAEQNPVALFVSWRSGRLAKLDGSGGHVVRRHLLVNC